MPLQNRVTPEGAIVAVAARGLVMGNRGGCFHSDEKALRRRRWASKQWICCRLEFKERRREVMAPGRYTELFFLDEATALAAGHRPCFECRRHDALWFATLWSQAHARELRATAAEMDDVLHAERVGDGGEKLVYEASLAELPSGVFVRLQGQPYLVVGGRLALWTAEGYVAATERPPTAQVEVLTPRSIVDVLVAGFCPAIHPTAAEQA